MFPDVYNIDNFMESIKDLDFMEMISKAEEEAYEVEHRLAAGLPRKEKPKAIRYREQLGRLLFFLRYGARPGGITERELVIYRRLSEYLVQREVFKPDIMRELQ